MLIWSSQEISFGCCNLLLNPSVWKGEPIRRKLVNLLTSTFWWWKARQLFLELNNNMFWGKFFSCFLVFFIYFSNWTFLSPHAKTLQNIFQQTEMTYFDIKESRLVITDEDLENLKLRIYLYFRMMKWLEHETNKTAVLNVLIFSGKNSVCKLLFSYICICVLFCCYRALEVQKECTGIISNCKYKGKDRFSLCFTD